MKIGVRVDGGPDIGFGHLMRSKALTEVLKNQDHIVDIATATPQATQSVFSDIGEIRIIELPSRSDPEPFIDWLDTGQPDIVFTDAYPVDTEYQQAIKNQVPLAVLQDDNRHAVCADLFINGNLYATDLDYEFVGEPPDQCLGAEYVLLRKEIRELAKEEPPWREEPKRAIVLMGGSDIANLTPTILRAFDGINIDVDAIVGPGFSDKQEQTVREAAAGISPTVSVVRDPDDLANRIFQADFAVSTASSTTYELLALGTPVISIPVVDNQKMIAEALDTNNCGIVLKDEVRSTKLKKAIRRYFNNQELRKRYTNISQKIVDGEGVKRVRNNIINLAK